MGILDFCDPWTSGDSRPLPREGGNDGGDMWKRWVKDREEGGLVGKCMLESAECSLVALSIYVIYEYFS